jgi:Holliday junction resolvasome RuvABC endonuclease subunit
MNILTLDPAESTGYALVRIENGVADIHSYGHIDIDRVSDFEGDWCIDLMKQLDKLVEGQNIQHVTIEDYFFSNKFAKGCNLNAAYRTAIHIWCRQKNLPYTILNISEWKKFVAGRSVPTKEQKLKWGKEPSKKLYMQQALWDRWGFKFANHSLSNSTGKPILFRYDVVDAVAQAVYFSRIYMNANKVVLSVPVPEDVVWKKVSKKSFTYDVLI